MRIATFFVFTYEHREVLDITIITKKAMRFGTLPCAYRLHHYAMVRWPSLL